MFSRTVRNMRNLDMYLFSEHLSHAYYDQDKGLDIVESHFFKASYSFLSLYFQQIPTTMSLTFTFTLILSLLSHSRKRHLWKL